MYQYARTLPLPPSPQALCHYPVCTGMQCGCFYFLGALFSSLSSNCIGETTPLCPVSTFACPTHLHWSFLGNLLYNAQHLGPCKPAVLWVFPGLQSLVEKAKFFYLDSITVAGQKTYLLKVCTHDHGSFWHAIFANAIWQ